jgi:hypothetical protein
MGTRRRFGQPLGSPLISLRAIANAMAANNTINLDDHDDNSATKDLLHFYQLMTNTLQFTYNNIKSKPYFMQRKPYHCGFAYLERDLQDKNNDNRSPPWLTKEEFLQKYWMHRKGFHQLLSMMQDHPVFQSSSNKPQSPVAHQLLVLLHYLDISGSGVRNPTLR